jgi:hypothetical protein
MVAIVAACGKSPAPAPSKAATPTQAAPSPRAAPETAGAAEAEPDYTKLAADFQVIRCQLLGAALPDEQLYVKQGYADGAAFQTAFAAAAKRKPEWAKQTLTEAIARSCGDAGAPATAPAAATPVQP